MTTKFAKRVRERFRERLAVALPMFRKIDTAESPPGWPVFEWRFAPDFAFYVRPVLHSMYDQFTVEVAWSRHGHFPAYGMPAMSPDEPAANGEFLIRLPRLRGPALQQELWWTVGSEPSLAQATGTGDGRTLDPRRREHPHERRCRE